MVQSTTPEAARPVRWLNVAVWVIVFALLAVLGWGLVNSTETRPEVGQVAPTFPIQFFNGYQWENRASATLNDMQGKVVVLNFWASWCVECRVEAELLEQAWQQYQDKGAVFLGIAYVDSEPKSLAYLREFNITYPNAPDLRSVASDEYEITGVPETFFIDKTGQIANVVIGPVSASVLFAQLEQLLAQ